MELLYQECLPQIVYFCQRFTQTVDGSEILHDLIGSLSHSLDLFA